MKWGLIGHKIRRGVVTLLIEQLGASPDRGDDSSGGSGDAPAGVRQPRERGRGGRRARTRRGDQLRGGARHLVRRG